MAYLVPRLISNWRGDRHFTWSFEPREGLAACSAKRVPSFLSYFKTLSLDLFHNGGLLTYSFIYMIISLSNLVSMCKIQRKTFFQTRSERLIIIHVKEHINRPPLWKRSIGPAAGIQPATARSTIKCSFNWANPAAVITDITCEVGEIGFVPV